LPAEQPGRTTHGYRCPGRTGDRDGAVPSVRGFLPSGAGPLRQPVRRATGCPGRAAFTRPIAAPLATDPEPAVAIAHLQFQAPPADGRTARPRSGQGGRDRGAAAYEPAHAVPQVERRGPDLPRPAG